MILLVVVPITSLAQPDPSKINQFEGDRRVGYWEITGSMAEKEDYAPNAKYQEGAYENGRRVGKWIIYFPNGNKRIVMTFKRGLVNGLYEEYYEDGGLFERGVWNHGKNCDTLTRYYPDGKLRQVFLFDTRGKRDGIQTYYHPNGEKELEGNFKQGRESGEFVRFYADGTVKTKMTFNNGHADESSIQQFAPSTPIDEDDVFNNPDIDQKLSEPIDLGSRLTSDGTIKVGKVKDGESVYYRPDRQISHIGKFLDGRLIDGRHFVYNIDGVLLKIEYYRGGRYVGDAPEDTK